MNTSVPNIAKSVESITKDGINYVTWNNLEETLDSKKVLALKHTEYLGLMKSEIDKLEDPEREKYHAKVLETRRKFLNRKTGSKFRQKDHNETIQLENDIEYLKKEKECLKRIKMALINDLRIYQNILFPYSFC